MQVKSIQFIRHTNPFSTAAWIKGQGERAIYDPLFFHLARSIVRFCREHDPLTEVLAICDFVANRVRYTLDPQGVELAFGPWAMVDLIGRFGRWSEDCESIECLLYTLLRSIGLSVRVVIVSFDGPLPEHVYLQVAVSGVFLSIDASEKTITPRMLRDVQRLWVI